MIFIYLIFRFLFVFSTNIGFQHGEEDNIWNVINIVNGRSIYLNPDEPPFEIYLYTPLSQMINALIVYLFNIKNLYYVSITLRFISLIYNLLTATIVYYVLLKMFSLSRHIAFCISTIAFCTLIHLNWTVRVDSLSILFSLFTIVYYVNFIQYTTLKNTLVVSVLITISIYIKQDAVQFICIFPICSILLNSFKSSLQILFFTSLLTVIVFIILKNIFGDAFENSVIGGLNNPYSVLNSFSVLNRYFQIYNFLPIIFIIGLFWGVTYCDDIKVKSFSIIGIGVFIFACIASMKLGAWVNYFSIFNLIGIIVSGIFILKLRISLNLIKSVTLIFLFYFITGIIYHFLTPELHFSQKEILMKKKISNIIRDLLPNNFKVYTNDDILELYLFDKTIFPNQVFYPEMNSSFFKLREINRENIYVIQNSDKYDYVKNTILNFNDSNSKIYYKIDGYSVIGLK